MKLKTHEEVINALGGYDGLMALTGATYNQARNWGRTAMPDFPSKTYLVMQDELRKRGHTAPPELWRMIEPQKRAK
jgi:hypothetical protein